LAARRRTTTSAGSSSTASSRRSTAAERSTKRLPVLAIDVDLRFASAADRAAFAADAAAAVRDLAARYHDEGRTGGRWYRLVLLAHPRPQEELGA
jgi:hypothetical protein